MDPAQKLVNSLPRPDVCSLGRENAAARRGSEGPGGEAEGLAAAGRRPFEPRVHKASPPRPSVILLRFFA
ncbi:hypothetical protein SAV14893_084070 [Streptomyces avermitilis]|uniref:Uncharacterized protein n=1 Tax=Streptomyces avermitilis TaxID=33903 RepID=A0A4D4MB32_STRAX|nr:hypothetical protein SAV14893_084070 [Streptomyces avermitilis]